MACPMCGRKFNVVKVVSWPLPADEADAIADGVYVPGGKRVYKLCGVNLNGEICCSYDNYCFATREEADKAASLFRTQDLEELACEQESGPGAKKIFYCP
jgi:hypothetical protein